MDDPPAGAPGWTYARSGVDVGARGQALAAFLAEVRYRARPDHGRPVRAPGHYAGLVRIGRETLAVTTDTVGTKVQLAERLGRWEEVGEDLVGANVNDLASVGARPAGLVDTILCARPEPAVFAALGRGLDRGLRAAGCSLLGGETAVVPSIVQGIDLGGTAVGFFPRGRRPVLGERIRPGDALLGIPSNGLHANGFTLVRRLLEERSVDLARPRPGAAVPLGEELLAPTRIYTGAAEAIAARPETHGLAHLSGGGVRNLVRLHARVAFVLERWPPPPPLFDWLQRLGEIADAEMFRTFNMGIGFVLAVAPTHLAETRRRIARAGAPDAVVIGHVERGRGVRVPSRGLSFEGYD
ncbi:MAG TPA: phosphoribosylformylglycinamidine cyclo-ligase [Thermoplasmata archaeon]|nr:phosphoribosylformylglycinamidine cyclo-ligase [Thermoplasmata archaeon]